MNPYIPTEREEQEQLFIWAAMQKGKYPELQMMYHIPNGGSRNPIEGANLKKQGVKAGVPDICLPVPRGIYHGLYIELKRQKGGKVENNQAAWITSLSEQGYKTAVCLGFHEAAFVVMEYLKKGL